MARIYQPKQRKDGRWDYTASSDDEGWCHAVGYCAGWHERAREEYAARFGEDLAQSFVDDQERRRPFKDRYHLDGHATAEDALACFDRHQLDQSMRLRAPTGSEQALRKCAVCGGWCAGLAEVGEFFRAWLCPDHLEREHVEAVFAAHRGISPRSE